MRSITFRIFSLIIGLLLILLLVLNYVPVILLRDRLMAEKESSFSSHGAVIASALSALDTLSEDSVTEVIRVLDIHEYDRIAVCNYSGLILYDSIGEVGQKAVLSEIYQAMDGQTVFHSSYVDDQLTSSYVIPISYKGTITGSVFLYEDDTDTAYIMKEFRSLLRTFSIIVSSGAMIIAGTEAVSLYRRFHKINESMSIVGKGDFSHRVDVSGKDELSELSNAFNILTERLETNELQRRQFVADASHELKTPLTSIRLLSDSILQNDCMDTNTVREFVANIGEEAYRLQRTTDKLLALSRLDDSRSQGSTEPVDVKRITLRAMALLAPLAKEMHLSILSVLEDGCVVMANADDIYNIIFNLTENAIKYNVENGSVTIKLVKDKDSVLLTVADTGIGIKEEERLNIFTRFYRIDKARSKETGGSGLGLSIVHDAVLRYHGSVTVGANKPQGTIFTVTFPGICIDETAS